MSKSVTKRLIFLLGSVFVASPGIATDEDFKLLDCAQGGLASELVLPPPGGRPLTVTIRGVCTLNITIKRDDVTLVGDGGVVNGTIAILGARRVVIRNLTVSSPTGAGISGTDNAAFTVEDSNLERNGTEGVTVRNGAHASIRRNFIANNGVAGVPDTGRGIDARHGGAVDARNNTIVNNRSDGIGVFNNAYARLTENTIEGNGRLAAGEAGVQVNRSRVRANGNIIRNNTGSAAIIIVNHSDYRTGTGVNTVDFPDNEFAFERIEHAVGPGLLALDVNQGSYGDFRQVNIVGSISVGAQTMMQVRGDEVGPNQVCSTVDFPPGGFISVSSRNSFLRLRFTRVTPGAPASAFIDVTNPCPPGL